MWKIQNSKFQKSKTVLFVKTPEKKIFQKMFERIQKRFEGGVAFWSFGSPESHVNETEQNCEKLKTQNFKTPKQYVCEDHWEENSENVWKDLKAIWGRSSVCKFRLPVSGEVSGLTKNWKIHKKNVYFHNGSAPGEATTEIWKESAQSVRR